MSGRKSAEDLRELLAKDCEHLGLKVNSSGIRYTADNDRWSVTVDILNEPNPNSDDDIAAFRLTGTVEEDGTWPVHLAVNRICQQSTAPQLTPLDDIPISGLAETLSKVVDGSRA